MFETLLKLLANPSIE